MCEDPFRETVIETQQSRMTGGQEDVMETEDGGPRLRRMFCSLGEITRADGSVILAQAGMPIFCRHNFEFLFV